MRILRAVVLFAVVSSYLPAADYVVDTAGDTSMNAFGTTSGSSSGDLRWVLSQIDLVTPSVPVNITFNLSAGNRTIQLNRSLPVINVDHHTAAVTIDGTNSGTPIVIDGHSNMYPGFLVRQGAVTMKNLTIQNTRARGGSGGGGAMGAGGAVFVCNTANVTLDGVTITNAQAQGGDGQMGFPRGGGGGWSGTGGYSSSGGGGGGGLGSRGSDAGQNVGGSGAGGGGISATVLTNNGSGGIDEGGNGYAGGAQGASSGGSGAGAGSGSGGSDGGGGGGGQFDFSPSGGGGGGGVSGAAGAGYNGGMGGFGGGGGGQFTGSSYTGGTGGFGGGGGGYNGMGGFGGGGGDYHGNGGFGGGGGGGTGSTNGAGGIGGGQGGSSGSGGGAGLGGGIFVMGSGGTLTIQGNTTLSMCGVTAGNAGDMSATAGAAAATDLFIMNGTTVQFAPSSGQTVTLSGSIGDDSTSTLPGPGYTPGSGSGGALTMAGAGTLVLQGTNTYKAGTTATATNGVIRVASDGNLGDAAGAVNLSGGAALEFSSGGVTTGRQFNLSGAGGGVTADTGTITLSGKITGSGGFTANGPGTVVLSGASNDYTGGTTVSGGTLRVAADANLGNAAGAVSLSGGGVLAFSSGLLTTNRQISLSGAGGAVTVDTGGTTITLSGKITNSGNFTVNGPGTVSLSGTTNDYTGTTMIAFGGTLSLAADNAFTTGTSNTTVTGTLNLNGHSAVVGTLSGAGTVTLGSATLTFSSGSSSTFSGQINGAGGFTKSGAGTLTLSGTNGYAGATVINGGTLRLGADNAFPSGSDTTVTGTFDLNGHNATVGILTGGGTVTLGSATLTVNTSSSPTFSGQINGSGGLTKTGSGTLVLSGSNGYTGATAVSAGELSLVASMAHAVTVASGARFSGTGTIGGTTTVQSGGTLRPGNSIGTMNFTDLNLNSGSVTIIEVSPTDSSKLIVARTATVGGTVQVVKDAGVYSNHTYQFLTADSVLNSFAALDAPVDGFFWSLLPSGTDVQLVLSTTPPPPPPAPTTIPTTALSGNALGLANYLNANASTTSELISLLNALNPEQLEAALNAISPSRNTFATFMSGNVSFLMANVISLRISAQRLAHGMGGQLPEIALLAQAADEELPWCEPIADESAETEALPAGRSMTILKKDKTVSAWAQALGEFVHQRAENQNPAFNSTTAGGIFGFDYYGFDHGLIGTALSYTNTWIHEDNQLGHANVQAYAASLYGTGYIGNGYIEAGAWGVYNQYRNDRNVVFSGFDATAKSSTIGWQAVPHLGGGYDVSFEWGVLEPFVSVDYALIFQRSYTEHGAPPVDMVVPGASVSMLRSQGGMNCYQTWDGEWGTLVLLESLSYVNRSGFGTGKMNGVALINTPTGFSVDALTSSQNLVAPAAEISYRSNSNTTFSLSYQGEFGSGYRSNAVLVKFGKLF